MIVCEEPITITYEQPRERVLMNAARDANPFLAVYESLYMLAGHNDVEGLAFYAKQFKEYSDDGKTLNGAYGYRWRKAWSDWREAKLDQLNLIVDHLTRNNYSRRAVLQMWDVENDLLKMDTGRDLCCNLSVCFAITGGWNHGEPKQLDMTVFNRSNDLIWGCLGANVVHFSFLQEYMAARIGVGVGVYNQISNNLHVYESNWKPERWLAPDPLEDFYQGRELKWPLLTPEEPWEKFDEECDEIVERYKGPGATTGNYSSSFLRNVAQPLFMAWQYHKDRDYQRAIKTAQLCWADDWRTSAVTWLQRREVRHASKTTGAK